MTFSAGTVVLDIWPSLRGVQAAIAREAQAMGATFEKEIGGGIDRANKRLDKSAANTSGAFATTLRAKINKALEDVGSVKLDVDDRESMAKIEAFRQNAKAVLGKDLEADIRVNAAGVLIEIKALEAQAQAILDDTTMDVDVRTNAGAARKDLVELREQIQAMQGLTRQEQAARVAAARAEAKAERDAITAREADARTRVAILGRTRQAEEQNARAILAINKRADADRLTSARLSNRQVVKEYDDVAAHLKNLLTLARTQESGAVQKAGRTGTNEDLLGAVAAIKARYEAEEHYQAAAAKSATAHDLEKVASAKFTSAEVEHAWKNTYDDITHKATIEAAEQASIARVVAANQRAAASSAAPTGLFQRFQQSNIGQAANSMRLFNGYLLTAVTVGPTLIPIIATLTAVFGAMSVAVGAAALGVGVLVGAFLGIGTALQAMYALDKEKLKQTSGSGAFDPVKDTRGLRNAQEQLARAREDYGQRIDRATKAEAQAERSLADAQRQAADSIAAADRRQQQAEDTLTKAVKDAAQAQKDLVAARETARRQLEDMNNQLVSGLLDEQLAYYNLQEAAAQYNAVLEDDQATAREKEIARLQYEQQVQQYKELQIQNQRLTKDVADANAKGVEGSDQVVQAQQNVVDTTQAVADAQDGVAQAAADAAQAQIDAVQSVADAQQNLADSQADLSRAYVEEARTMADAERGVADAMYDLQQQSVSAGVAGSAAFDNLAAAMANLSPAGQQFADFLYGLKPFLDTLRAAAQSGVLPALMNLINVFVTKYGDQIVAVVGGIAGALGELLNIMAEQIQTPWWQDFITQMFQMAPDVLLLLGKIGGALIETISGIMKAFLPYAPGILDFILGLADGMAQWAKELGDSKGFAGFMDYVKKEAPKLVNLIGLMLEAFVKLAIGLAPYADKLIDLMTNVFGWLAAQTPEDLGKWAVGILGIVAAIQALAGAMSALLGAAGLLLGLGGSGGGVFGFLGAIFGVGGGAAAAGGAAAGAAGAGAAEGIGAAAGGTAVAGAATSMTPVGWILLIVAAVLALAAAILYLYNKSEAFRQFWDDLWRGVGKVASEVGAGIKWVIENVIAPTIEWLWTRIVKPVTDFIGGAFNIVGQILGTLGSIADQVFRFIIAPALQWFYDHAVKPWWENGVKPIFEAFGNFISDHVAPAFSAGVNAVAEAWAGLIDAAKIPVAFVVNTVINKGIIDTFNKLTKYFPGMKQLDHVTLPDGWDTKIDIPQLVNPPKSNGSSMGIGGGYGTYASGGVLPGYTPGRDVHRFVSASGGVLDLSGGEGILVPELVRALGAGWVYENNRRARAGQPLAYADGGILGWLGRGAGAVSDAISGVTKAATDFLSNPGQYLKDLVAKLLGTGNEGIAGLAAGMANALTDGIANALGFGAPSETGAIAPPARAGMGWRAMEAIISTAFPSIAFSSAYRPGSVTIGGAQSYHALGRAIDMVKPSMALFNWISKNYPDSQELLYTPAGSSQILRGGSRGNTSGALAAQHYSHVHWAYEDGGVMPLLFDQGGALPPGLSLVLNRTDKPEQVLSGEQFDKMRGGSETKYVFDIENMGYSPKDVAREIEKIRRDRLASKGMKEIGVSIG